MARAGYDPLAAPKMWARIGDEEAAKTTALQGFVREQIRKNLGNSRTLPVADSDKNDAKLIESDMNFARLDTMKNVRHGPKWVEYFSTHPSYESRVQDLLELALKLRTDPFYNAKLRKEEANKSRELDLEAREEEHLGQFLKNFFHHTYQNYSKTSLERWCEVLRTKGIPPDVLHN